MTKVTHADLNQICNDLMEFIAHVMSSAPDLDKPVLIFEPKELTVTYPTVPCW